MDVYKIIQDRRSIRKFDQKKLEHEDLLRMVECAKVAPSGANLQPLRYIIIDDETLNSEIFPCLHWAMHLKEDGSPKAGEHPVAYIATLIDTRCFLTNNILVDVGLSLSNMILYAQSKGIGSCIIGAFNKDEIRSKLQIDPVYQIHSLLALGYPKESPIVVSPNDGNLKYYKDQQGQLYVPKLALDDVLIRDYNENSK